jgi:hypothetical protein
MYKQKRHLKRNESDFIGWFNHESNEILGKKANDNGWGQYVLSPFFDEVRMKFFEMIKK